MFATGPEAEEHTQTENSSGKIPFEFCVMQTKLTREEKIAIPLSIAQPTITSRINFPLRRVLAFYVSATSKIQT